MPRSTKASGTLLQKTKMCRFNDKGVCKQGEACGFAHSLSDLQRCPDLRKTQLCMAFRRNGTCRDGDACRYAHGTWDLRPNDKESNETAKPLAILAAGNEPVHRASLQQVVAHGADNTPSSQKNSALWVYQMPTFFPVAVPVIYTMAQMQGNTGAPADDPKWSCPATGERMLSRQTTAERSPAQTTDEGFDIDSMTSDDAVGEYRSNEGAEPYQVPNVAAVPPTMMSTSASAPQGQNVAKQQKSAGGKVRPTKVPCDMLSKTKLCMFYLKGACTKGESCSFAHELGDLRNRPDLLYTRMCLAFQKRGSCKDGENCRFAHDETQLRPLDAGDEMLQQWEQGRPKDGSRNKMIAARLVNAKLTRSMAPDFTSMVIPDSTTTVPNFTDMSHSDPESKDFTSAPLSIDQSPPSSPGSPMFPVKATFVHFQSLEPKCSSRRARSSDTRT